MTNYEFDLAFFLLLRLDLHLPNVVGGDEWYIHLVLPTGS